MAGISTGDMSPENKTEEDKKWELKSELERILQKKDKWMQIDDIDVAPGCPPGENFVADVLRVIVYGRRLCLGVWTDFRKNFIVKRIPDASSFNHKFYDCLRFFQNEITAYEQILPVFQSYLNKKSQDDVNEFCFPKFYGQCQHFLVLQDLQTEGYQVVNRIKGFSTRECTLILQELSKFHALSFAIKQDNKISFLKTAERLKENVFCESKDGLTSIFWENSIRFAMKSLKESMDPQLIKASEILNFSSGRVLQILIKIIKPNISKFEVICHGDLWNNNILLRYCESGYPIGVKFIDLQTMRYGSCVLDVMHVLFTSSRPVVYEKYLDQLLFEYYQFLVANLRNLEMVPTFTFDEFMLEFKEKISFGVFVACLMFTCITRTSSPEPSEGDFTKDRLTSQSEFDKIYKSLSPTYHERLHGLFLALTKSGLI